MIGENYLKALDKKIDKQTKEIERLNNIIKEARELTNKIIEAGWDYQEKDNIAIKQLEILDKATKPTIKPYIVEDHISIGNTHYIGVER